MGDTERSATDRKRDRRIKKKHQKKKAKMQEKKLQEKVRRAGAKDGAGKLDRGTTMKVIEKAVKSGQVKLVSNIQGVCCILVRNNCCRALQSLGTKYNRM